jgi:hypothetical protein
LIAAGMESLDCFERSAMGLNLVSMLQSDVLIGFHLF